MADEAPGGSTADPITHRRVVNIAGPIVLSNATVPILGLVDTAVVGQLGAAEPIGAVGLGAVILSAVYAAFAFLRMGTVGLTAQAAGARDTPEVAAMLTRSLLIGAVAGFGLVAAQALIFSAAFAISPASEEVEALARDYLGIRIWSAPAAIALFGVTGWLIALERTRAVLAVQLWTNGLNILLDLWFVLGLDWGVSGVATATFLAEWSGLILGLWFCRAALAAREARDPALILNKARLMRMASVNFDIMIRTLLLQAILVSFMFFGAGFGAVTLAANQVLLQFLFVTSYAMDGFAFAAESLVGQATGARNRARLNRAARLTGVWGMGIGAALALGFAVGGPALINVMTTAPDVRTFAATFLPWMVATPIVGAAAWILDGIFIGATRTRDMRNMMAVSCAVYFVLAFALVPGFGNHGLWLALLVSFAMRGLTLALRYPSLMARVDGAPGGSG